ncbi:hypothetical protein [Arthrobacter mangrovi]|uniref:Uncharacterized protein n=1 Tax=Arthrobacter mangrovi TaxID=2966350 RepID=A0ABQ5MT78_9MICC|nr:hypothetical protein [Arthrobacter mangrovi]GLB67185.1 hypothetical protein AHIS1636_16240 [Arthrobacter mangrovi]
MNAALAKKKITVSTVDQAHRLLNAAVEEFQREAAVDRLHGVLVTKTGPGQYIVELTDQVPYGFTEELVAIAAF